MPFDIPHMIITAIILFAVVKDYRIADMNMWSPFLNAEHLQSGTSIPWVGLLQGEAHILKERWRSNC